MSRYHYERLSAESASHLMLESSRSFNHSLSILTFDAGPLAGEGGGVDVAEITRGIEARLHLAPRFRQRLKWIPYEDYPVWVDDDEFNLGYHVRHTALPHPGRRDQLHKLAARLMSSRLHRSRPMWECWVVEGLEDDRFALIGKLHSCMIEADSGADLFQAVLSADPEEVYEEPRRHTPRPKPSGLEIARDELLERARLPGRMFSRARRFAADNDGFQAEFARRIAATARLFGYSVVPPRPTPINGQLGPHRGFDSLVLPLDRVQEIHRRFDCSVHDVVLTVVCRALRSYLQHHLVHCLLYTSPSPRDPE